MILKFKKLNENAVVPTKANLGDAGWDLTATTKEIVDTPGYGFVRYKFGIAVKVPDGHVGLLFPRSSVSKTGLFLANGVGVIDSGYTGELEARFKYVPKTNIYEVGERVVQLVILPLPEFELQQVEELEQTARGEAGFGSSGTK